MRADTLLRRCAAVVFLPQESIDLDLPALLSGSDGVVRNRVLLALAAHADTPVAVDAAEAAALAQLSPEAATPREQLTGIDDASVHKLILAGLIEVGAPADNPPLAHWDPLAAVAHRHGRWHSVHAPDTQPDSDARSLSNLVRKLGAPPDATVQRGSADSRVALARPTRTTAAELLRRRATCRNFDRARPLPLDVAATLLHGVFGAQQSVTVPAGAEVLKKLSPSGGGLHPTEAYVIALDVEGLASGFWHYRSKDHALDPVRAMPADELRALALKALAGQHWFADSPMLVVHACRFGRSFWKYRQHAKAYRAVILDIGHLSQTAYLLATELGLGAFVTAAINEPDLEQALGLDPMVEGPLAISGFGYRAATQANPEFDPAAAVWPAGGAS